jgi:hypothetical protein
LCRTLALRHLLVDAPREPLALLRAEIQQLDGQEALAIVLGRVVARVAVELRLDDALDDVALGRGRLDGDARPHLGGRCARQGQGREGGQRDPETHQKMMPICARTPGM